MIHHRQEGFFCSLQIAGTPTTFKNSVRTAAGLTEYTQIPLGAKFKYVPILMNFTRLISTACSLICLKNVSTIHRCCYLNLVIVEVVIFR